MPIQPNLIDDDPPNRYPATCDHCGERVPAGDGVVRQDTDGGWYVVCDGCVVAERNRRRYGGTR